MLPIMTEIGRGVGWQKWTPIAMLWAYFDESGEHFPKGHPRQGELRRLTFGGALARFEDWESLSLEWAAALEGAGVTEFHMTDFEARRPPFDWDKEKRERVLNALLDIAIRHVPTFLGYVIEPDPGKPPLEDAYESLIAKLLKDAAIETFNSKEPLTFVFAKHKQISAKLIGAYFDLWDDGDGRLQFGGFGNPATICPLQVADIVAYELSRAARESQPPEMRYPLARLAKEARVSCVLRYFNPASSRAAFGLR